MRYLAKQEGNSTFILKDENGSFEATLKVAKRKLLLVQELEICTESKAASIYFEKKGRERLKIHCFDGFESFIEDHTSGLQLYKKDDIDIWSRKKIATDYTELEIKELRSESESLGFFGEIEGDYMMTNKFVPIADLCIGLKPESDREHFIILCFLLYSLYCHRFCSPNTT